MLGLGLLTPVPWADLLVLIFQKGGEDPNLW